MQALFPLDAYEDTVTLFSRLNFFEQSMEMYLAWKWIYSTSAIG